MNVIGFVYSVLQFAALVRLMRKNKHLESHPKRDLLDFTMDHTCNGLMMHTKKNTELFTFRVSMYGSSTRIVEGGGATSSSFTFRENHGESRGDSVVLHREKIVSAAERR